MANYGTCNPIDHRFGKEIGRYASQELFLKQEPRIFIKPIAAFTCSSELFCHESVDKALPHAPVFIARNSIKVEGFPAPLHLYPTGTK